MKEIEQICYNAALRAKSKAARRCSSPSARCSAPVDGMLEVIEIAPGVDLEKDVIGQMGFRPRVSAQLKRMDRRLFCPEPMNLRADLDVKPRRALSLPVV